MALTRTDTALLLESTDGVFYWTPLVDIDGVIVPNGDATDPQAASGDGYVALLADDGQVWRWSLRSETIDDELVLSHRLVVSPDQSETTAGSIRLVLNGQTYGIGVVVEEGIARLFVGAASAVAISTAPVRAHFRSSQIEASFG